MKRLDENPLLTPDDLQPTRSDLRVLCTLNPAAVKHGSETLLLVRVGEAADEDDHVLRYVRYDPASDEVRVDELRKDDPLLEIRDARGYYVDGMMLLTSLSHLRIARSTDGRRFRFDPEPAIFPDTPYEAYGCEDPRITWLDGTYWITYTAVSDRGVTVALASTQDFRRFEKHGIIFPPYQKDVAIFPEKVRGMYVCRHRPYKSEFNAASIWTAYSPDLHCWGHHELTHVPIRDTWEAERVGCGAPPIRVDDGWLEIYHAADSAGKYHLGVMITEAEHPERIVYRAKDPVLGPEAEYEKTGVYGNCVFSNGLVVEDDGTMIVYYGAADRICAGAVTTVDEMVAAAKKSS
jgi:predicted GH43/DUF377 family glycosyl hydrolase